MTLSLNPNPNPARRIRRFAISPALIVELAKHSGCHVTVVDHELPEDAIAIHVMYDPRDNLVWVLVESKTFDLIEEAAIVPKHPQPTFRYDK